jgi:polyhydroxyalkanoate synthase
LRASPETFSWERSLDLLQSSLDPAALRNHFRVERWTLDEFAMPRRLFAELAQLLGREDRFVRGTLRVGRQLAAPSRIDVPVLCIADPRCRIAPRQAVQPFLDAIATADKSLLEYEREVGVCLHHVGPLVGRRAHSVLWPEILRWVGARWRDAAAVEVAGKPAGLKPRAGNAEDAEENREDAEKNGIAAGNG